MTLIIPPRIKQGETIGIISPSAGLAPFAMHRVQNAIRYLKQKGFRVLIGRHALKNDGYVSASIKDRLADLHSMFQNQEVKMIITTIGGNNANQLLPYINYSLIKKHPKIFIGYSDISVLHLALQKKANLATYYGPCLMTQFGEYPHPLKYTVNHFAAAVMANRKISNTVIHPSRKWTQEVLDWFKKEDLKRPRKTIINQGFAWLKEGYARGIAWGGTIPSINLLLGTKYWFIPKNAIFFLDIPEGKDIFSGLPLAEVDAYLTQLESAGVFKAIAGLIIGRPYRYNTKENKIFKKLVKRITKPYNFPILINVDLGHTDPIITFRYGQEVILDSKNNLFQLVW